MKDTVRFLEDYKSKLQNKIDTGTNCTKLGYNPVSALNSIHVGNITGAIDTVLNILNGEIVKSREVCPECGYPTFKFNHEKFRRCHGCEWTETRE